MSDLIVKQNLTAEQMDIIKNSICKGASDMELKYFLYVCQKTGLDPMTKQVYSVARFNSQTGMMERTIQTGIDGLRLIAERTGKYEGQEGPFWCGNDGVWLDVWTSSESPVAAKVGVYKAGSNRPTYGVAKYSEYCQTTKNGVTTMWKKFPTTMLAKVAEAIALKKSFPQDLSGIHSTEEMQQDQNEEVENPAFVNPEPNKLKIETDEKSNTIAEILVIAKDKCQNMTQIDKLSFLKNVIGVNDFKDLGKFKNEALLLIKESASKFEKQLEVVPEIPVEKEEKKPMRNAKDVSFKIEV
jgi:phage recombination protein Bet